MFTLENDQLALDADLVATVPEFKQLWDEDESADKHEAMAYFRFIYHTNNPKSPYHGYPGDKRGDHVIAAMFPESMKKWNHKKDKRIAAIADLYYMFLNLSPERQLLDVAEQVLHDTAKELKKGSKKEIEEKQMLIEKMHTNFEKVRKLREVVNEEENKLKMDARGNRVSAREDPNYKPLYVPKSIVRIPKSVAS